MLIFFFGPSAKYPLIAIKAAADSVYVAVVVDFGNGPSTPSSPISKCVTVPQGSTLLDALSQAVGSSNLTFASSGLLCTIDGYPTPQVSSSCGQAIPGGYRYWSFWTSNQGTWSYAKLGAGSIPATTGAVEGWRFEYNGNGNPNDPPPSIAANFQAICPGVTTATTSTTSPLTTTTTTQPTSTQVTPSTTEPLTSTTTEAPTTNSASTPPSTQAISVASSTTSTASTTSFPTTSQATATTLTTLVTSQSKSATPATGSKSSNSTLKSLALIVVAIALVGGGAFGYMRLKRRR